MVEKSLTDHFIELGVFDPGRGSVEHYQDAELYDWEYRRRRRDVHFYTGLAKASSGPVFEVGCGTGRLLLPMAKATSEIVLGLDRSQSMLLRCRARLRSLPAQRRGQVAVFRGDLRNFKVGQKVGLIVAGFNTLQHLYSRPEIAAFFACAREALLPKGKLAFDVLLPDLDWLTRDPNRAWARTRFRHPVTRQKLLYSSNTVYDPISQLAFIRLYYEPLEPGPVAQRQVVRLTHRQFFPEELLHWVESSGFVLDRRYGGFGEEPLMEVSESQVLVCARK